MLNDLTIIHRRKPGIFEATEVSPDNVWATCLRSLAFVRGTPTFGPKAGDQVFRQREAYEFLLEIICGLHSPIVGETEVFGQFKSFAAAWSSREWGRAPLIQRLLNDAKAIRSQYLSGIGTQSYGSWLRKNLSAPQTHVLGAGQLAGEILPYLQKQSEVTVHARRPGKVKFNANICALDQNGFIQGALVVAAPLSAEQIRGWLNGRVPAQIFDLRDNSADDPIFAHAISLTHIFGQIEKTRIKLLPVIEQAKQEITQRARAASALEKVRPQGWDDLCA